MISVGKWEMGIFNYSCSWPRRYREVYFVPISPCSEPCRALGLKETVVAGGTGFVREIMRLLLRIVVQIWRAQAALGA